MRKWNSVTMIILICLVTKVSAQSDMRSFVQKLEEKNKNTQSIVSDFNQVQKFSFLDDVLESNGKFYFMKPGMIKWEQLAPESYFFVINSEEAFKSEKGKIKKIPLHSPQIIGFRKFILESMDGTIFKSKDFISALSSLESGHKVELVPTTKTLKKMFEKVVLVFSKDSFLLTELSFYETVDDIRTMYFSNHKINTLQEEVHFNR